MTRGPALSEIAELFGGEIPDRRHGGQEVRPDPLLEPCRRLGVNGPIDLQGMEGLTIIVLVHHADGTAGLSPHRLPEQLIQAGPWKVSTQEQADI